MAGQNRPHIFTSQLKLNDMKQQTAVEWLEQKIFEEFKVPISNQVFEQAKAMEKEQIIDAYYGNIDGVYGYREAGEQYYNETYGKQELEI